MLNCFLRPQAAEQPPYHNPQLPVEQRVADLLGRMTLEEKVAQAHALWQMKRLIMDGQGNLSAEKSRAGAQRRHRRDHLACERKAPRQNAEFCNAIQRYLAEHTRLGIPAIVHKESLQGFGPRGDQLSPSHRASRDLRSE